jgi:hypothetical protein
MRARIAPPLLLLALGACVPPDFPRQAPYPFGLDAARRDALRAAEAQPGSLTPEREAELAALAQSRCPDWRAARLPHPLDAVRPNPLPSDRPKMGCHTQATLDAMLARPSDILDPPETMSPASAAALNRGIERHRTVGPVPLPDPARSVGGS